MEKKVRQVVRSNYIPSDLVEIYEYGVETFGKTMADIFIDEITYIIEELSHRFTLYPECRFLPTKTKIYRNIIFGKYLVIYRITPGKIEVLRALHGSRSVRIIKAIRSVKS